MTDLPDDALVPMRWVRQNFVPKDAAPDRLLTTGQAAAEFGFSPDTWRGWADSGRIKGAFRDEGETWRLPVVACREHVAVLRSGKAHNRRQRLGWDASTAPAARAGASADSEGKVVELRPAALGRRAADDAEPGSPGVAGPRRAHGRSGGRR